MKPVEEVGQSSFGHVVALSGDGSVLLAAAPLDTPAGPGTSNARGAVDTFVRSGSTWASGPKLTSDAAEDWFGFDLALSADGTTAAIAPTLEFGTSPLPVHVYRRVGLSWVETTRVAMTPGATPEQLALSADGTTLLIAAHAISGPGSDALIYRLTGSTATLQATLPITPSLSTLTAALSGDGSTAVIGAPRAGNGVVFVYARSASTWSLASTLTPPSTNAIAHQTGVAFGSSVATSNDGATILVGAVYDIGTQLSNGPGVLGTAWVFGRTGSAWQQQGGKLTPPSVRNFYGWLGGSVSLSADGNTALVGGYAWLDNAANWLGSLAVWKRSGLAWAPQPEPTIPVGGPNVSGFSGQEGPQAAMISGDGSTIAAGDQLGLDEGVRLFTDQPVSATPQLGSHCIVPNVVHKTSAAAERLLKLHDCTTATIRRARSKTAPAGQVVSQSPTAGKELAVGTPVHLVLSRGKR